MGGGVYFDKRAKRWYIQVYIDGKRERIWRDPATQDPFWSKRHAQKILGAMQHEVDEGGLVIADWKPNAPLSFDIYARAWLEDKANSVSAKTLAGYRTAIEKYAIPFFGSRDLRKIRARDLREFKEQLPLSEKGVYNVVGAVKTMYRDAYRDEDISRIPPFPALSQSLPYVDYLTIEQQQSVLDRIPERHRPIFEFGMEFGLRVQEVRALQKDCIIDGKVIIRRAFAENTLKESTKTGEKGERAFDLTEYARNILGRVEPHLGPFVFVRQDGKPYSNKDMNRIWRKACELAGVKIKLYNAMRHSLACQLLDNGEGIEVVRQILGHTNIKMTLRYTRRRVVPSVSRALERRRKVVEIKRKTKCQ